MVVVINKIGDMVPHHKMCCVCFEFIPYDELYVDENGDKWDNCVSCAHKVWKKL